MWSGKNEDAEHDVAKYQHLLRERMSLVHELANQKEMREMGKNKQCHDKTMTERKYGMGDYVLGFSSGNSISYTTNGRVR